jgi:hypothetical protein
MSKPRTLADHPNTRGTAAVADVTTSQTDTTAGRLLKVGDFGVGGEVTATLGTITNIDNLHTFISESAFGNQGLLEFSGVAGIPNGAYGVYVFPRSDRGMVLLFRNHVGDAEGEIYVTFRTTTKWQQPRRLFTQGTILGTVSQASGVPTGAIIERGSNGNGEYVKFADGTLICFEIYGHPSRITTNSVARADSWTFPSTRLLPRSRFSRWTGLCCG